MDKKPVKWSIDRADGAATRPLRTDGPAPTRGYPTRAEVPDDARARMVTLRNRWFGRSVVAGAVALAGCGGASATSQTETTQASTSTASCEPHSTSATTTTTTGASDTPTTDVHTDLPADAIVPVEEPVPLGGVPPGPHDD